MQKKISNKQKQLSNPISTGGGGYNFERHVQAMFLLALLVDGYSPIIDSQITELCFQGRRMGFNTDDLVVLSFNKEKCKKLLCQIKSNVTISDKSTEFIDVITAAWNDFNEASFDKETDKIALITDIIAKSNIKPMRDIYEKANNARSADDFLKQIAQSRLYDENTRKKLEILRNCLSLAKGSDLTDEELFHFCRVFSVVLFDGTYEKGIQNALCISLINCKSSENPSMVWRTLTDYAGECNQNAADIRSENVCPRIKELFDYIEPISKISTPIISLSEKMACAFLIGAWNERNCADIKVIEYITGTQYSEFLKYCRERIEANDPLFSLVNGTWRVSYRRKNWNQAKDFFYDDTIKRAFYLCTKIILEESKVFTDSGSYYLRPPKEEWFSNSAALRSGLIKGLCILSNESAPKTCSSDLIKIESAKLVRTLFEKLSWRTLAGLGDLLPIIAELSPKTFLQKLEECLIHKKTDMQKLFPKRESGLLNSNYLVYVLWSLERLSWIPDYFAACVRCLGILETIEHEDTNYADTPINTTINLLNAFKTQTFASFEQREAALTALEKESPELCWMVVKSLLPESSFFIHDSQKPEFIRISSLEKSFHADDTETLLDLYVNFAIKLSKGSTERLAELSAHLGFMSETALRSYFVEIIDNSNNWGDKLKYHIWDALCSLRVKTILENGQKIPNTESFSLLLKAISATKPESVWYQYLRLYSQTYSDYLLSDDCFKRRDEEQQNAVIDIFFQWGIESVKTFADRVNNPNDVGRKLGLGLNRLQIKKIIKRFSRDENSVFFSSVISGYIDKRGVCELLELGLDQFEVAFRKKLLFSIRFSPEIIPIIDALLPSKSLYWREVPVQFIWLDWPDSTIIRIIDELIEAERFDAIINAIGSYIFGHSLPDDILKTIMLRAIYKQQLNSLDQNAVRNIIKKLQSSEKPDIETIANIEYACLPFLSGFHSVQPKALFFKLANDSKFFCKLMETAFRPRNNKAKMRDLSEGEKQRIFLLVNSFRVVPGVDWNGIFVEDVFRKWIEQTMKWAQDNDREEVVQQTIGNGLSFASKVEGLPNDVILEVLEKPNNTEMRRGYSLGLQNQRGAHFIDPEGKPEIALSEQYKEIARVASKKGYSRFAELMVEIAENYSNEAERIKKENETEKRFDNSDT